MFNISTLSIKDLEYLVALDKYKNFCKAADVCFVSQPTLSVQIQKCESVLKTKIFIRSPKAIITTEQGAMIVQQAKKIIQEMQTLFSLSIPNQPSLSGPFHLGAISTLGPYFFPYLFNPFKNNFPEIQLFLHEDWTETLLTHLHSGLLDAVLLVKSSSYLPFSSDEIHSTLIFQEPLWVMLPKKHHLAKKKALQKEDLTLTDILLLKEGNCLRDQVISLCSLDKNPQNKSIPFHATTLETTRALVANNEGYAIVPQLAMKIPNPWEGEIVYRPFAEADIKRSIVLLYKQELTKRLELTSLIKSMRTIARGLVT